MRLVLGYTKNGEVIVLHVNPPRIEGATEINTHFTVSLFYILRDALNPDTGIARIAQLRLIYTVRDPTAVCEDIHIFTRVDSFWPGVTYYGQFRPCFNSLE